MFKWIAIIVVVALVAAIATPLYHLMSRDNDEAHNLVSATQRTSNKAGSLSDAFTDVVPPARNAPPPPQPRLGAATGPLTSPIAGVTGTGQSPEDTADPLDAEDPYEQYEHYSDHVVSEAMTTLAKLQRLRSNCPSADDRADDCVDAVNTEYINAIEHLQSAWEPRYVRAVDAYARFQYRIDYADRMAQEYFLVQRKLTMQIPDSKTRAKWELNDAKEFEIYMRWQEQANTTRLQAEVIMAKLREMNVIITKQRLSAQFTALYNDFLTVPPEITILHQELKRFQDESDRIQQQFGPA